MALQTGIGLGRIIFIVGAGMQTIPFWVVLSKISISIIFFLAIFASLIWSYVYIPYV